MARSKTLRPRWAPYDVDAEPPGDGEMPWYLEALRIPTAWELTMGAGITVAVLDSGVARLSGLRPTSYEPDGTPSSPKDVHGHGTMCASVIASTDARVRGIAPKASIVSIRVAGASGKPTIDNVEAALQFAQTVADVISCSFVLPSVTDGIREQVRLATNAGIPVIAAAGNEKNAEEPFPEQTPNAITVSGVNSDFEPFASAKHGDWIDIAGPGAGLIALTRDDDETDEFGESSGATAVAAGVAALALSMIEDSTKRRKVGRGIEGLFKATARQIPGGSSAVGAGLIDAFALLTAVQHLSEGDS